MNKWIEKNIIKILSIFLILGPIFDLITSVSINVFNLNVHIILFVKIIFILLLTYYSLFIYKGNKKNIIIYYILIGIYFISYILNMVMTKSIDVLFYEASHLFRNYFFPICLVNIFLIYEQKKQVSNKVLTIAFIEYLLLLFIPFITNTGFDSYAYSKVGSIGWFNSTNEIGGILSILFPISIGYLLSKNKKIIPILLLVFLYVIFSIGSKVPVLTTILTIMFFLILYFKDNPKKIKIFILPFIMVIALSIFLFPKTNFYKNIKIHLDFLEINTINDLLTYENIDHFIFSSRLKFLNETRVNYIESNFKDHLIGIGYIENYGTDEVNIKTIEMDYFDIFYRNGIVGFIIFILPIIFIIIRIKPNKPIELYTFILALILALFQGHILTAPSVSMYVIIILLNGGNYEKLLYRSKLQ